MVGPDDKEYPSCKGIHSLDSEKPDIDGRDHTKMPRIMLIIWGAAGAVYVLSVLHQAYVNWLLWQVEQGHRRQSQGYRS